MKRSMGPQGGKHEPTHRSQSRSMPNKFVSDTSVIERTNREKAKFDPPFQPPVRFSLMDTDHDCYEDVFNRARISHSYFEKS